MNDLPQGTCYRNLNVAVCAKGRNVYMDAMLKRAKTFILVQITFE